MTTVPTNKTQQVQVNPAAEVYQSTRNVPSGAFDGGASGLINGGKELGKAGDTYSALLLQMQEDDNDAEVKKLDNDISEAIRSSMYGDGTDASPGYYSLEKDAAVNGYVVAEDGLKKAIQSIGKNGSNEAVKRRVSEIGMTRLSRELDAMTKHAGTERIKAHDDVSLAREAQAAADASSAYNNPTVARNSVGIVEDEVDDYARRHNLSKEEKDVRLMTRRGATVKSIYDAAMAAEDISSAERVLKDYGDKVDPATKAAMQNDLRTQSLAKAGQALAEEALIKFPGDPSGAREYIRSVSEGKKENAGVDEYNRRMSETRGDESDERTKESEQRSLESEARTKYNHEVAKAEKVDKEKLKKANQEARAWLFEGKTMQELRKQKPDVWATVSGDNTTYNSLESTERNVAEGVLFASASDGVTVPEFKKLGVKDRAEFDANTIRLQVTPAEWNSIINSQDAARREMKALSEDKASFSAARAAVARAAQLPKGANRTAKHDNMLEEANTEISERVALVLESGRKPTQQEIDLWAGEIAVNLVSDPWFFTSGGDTAAFAGLATRRGRMSEAQKSVARVPVDKIPPIIDARINASLASRGITEVDDDLREEFAAAIALRDAERLKRLIKEAKGQ